MVLAVQMEWRSIQSSYSTHFKVKHVVSVRRTRRRTRSMPVSTVACCVITYLRVGTSFQSSTLTVVFRSE